MVERRTESIKNGKTRGRENYKMWHNEADRERIKKIKSENHLVSKFQDH